MIKNKKIEKKNNLKTRLLYYMTMNQHLNQLISQSECLWAIKQDDQWHHASYHDDKWHCDVSIEYDNLYVFDYTDDEEDDEYIPPYDEWQPLHEWIKTQYPEPVSVAGTFPLF